MTQVSSKVCILGDFAVGKTSTVERFVNSQFSDKYLTTIGVKVDTREVPLSAGLTLKLVLWDVAGSDRFSDIEFAYLRGASGYIFVADGTRAHSVATALELKRQAEDRYGKLPCVFLLNKSDLTHAWEISDQREQALRADCPELFTTSAKTGANVAAAIEKLAHMVAAREFSQPQ
jgi:small GTP-binding protein